MTERLYIYYLVVLGDLNGNSSRFERDFFHGPEHIRLHGKGELKAKVTDVIVQDPLKIFSILWINRRHILIAHRDACKDHTQIT